MSVLFFRLKSKELLLGVSSCFLETNLQLLAGEIISLSFSVQAKVEMPRLRAR